MAVQLALNSDWDIYFDADGELVLVDDGEEVAQHVKQRLDFHQGEWFLDQTIGMPWFQGIFATNSSSQDVASRSYSESLIKATILETPGVTALVDFQFNFDSINRAANYSFQFDTLWGEVSNEYFNLSLT